MKVVSSWLREFVSPEVTTSELAHTLTMSGLEVDGIDTIAPACTGVVVGEVLTCDKHPNADKLNVCMVSIGAKTSQIICGASNVRTGLKVAVATVGSVLPGNFKIKKAKIRGVESAGMICSESELGLTHTSEGIMELAIDAPVAMNIREYLNLDDEIIDIDITPNRGDCFSVLGVAREVAVNYNIPLHVASSHIKSVGTAHIATESSEPAHCPKYLARVVTNIDNTKSTPTWMADKLTRSGYALHSPVVDITNFVQLELGQPMHAFDRDAIDTAITVRLSTSGEELELLNGDTVQIKPETLVIADNSRALALAGIMGGMSSSTTTETSSIILESAFFDPICIAGKARDHGLHTESSLRFERGVDFNLTEHAMHRATELVLEICGGEAAQISSSIHPEYLPQRNEVCVQYNKIDTTLGFTLERSWIAQTFKNLDFEIVSESDTQITILPPSFRFDITVDVDLIEELARIYGYDKLPTKPLHIASSLSNEPTSKRKLLHTMLANGYTEVVNYSFISTELAQTFGGDITLLNPISSDMKVMRGSLIAGLVKTAQHNKRYGISSMKIFETGLCFEREDTTGQIDKIAGLIIGKTPFNYLDKERNYDFFDIKADVETLTDAEFVISDNPLLQPGQRADLVQDGEVIGFAGCLHPAIAKDIGLEQVYVFELLLAPLMHTTLPRFAEFAHYQASKRDISVLIDKKYHYNSIIIQLQALQQKFLSSINLIDIWQDDTMAKDHHSLTFSLVYQSDSKTLTDKEIDMATTEVVSLLTTTFNAQQR